MRLESMALSSQGRMRIRDTGMFLHRSTENVTHCSHTHTHTHTGCARMSSRPGNERFVYSLTNFTVQNSDLFLVIYFFTSYFFVVNAYTFKKIEKVTLNVIVVVLHICSCMLNISFNLH